MELLLLKSINTEGRIREDLGDVHALARSIYDNVDRLPNSAGLMHPVVVDDQNVLIAGGRRFTAFTLLNSNKVEDLKVENPDFFAAIPVTRSAALSPAERRMLEIEENQRRKEMTWQETVIGIADYHRLAEREALRKGEKWSQSLTGELLGTTQASVSIAIKVAKAIRANPEGEVALCDSLAKAIQVLAISSLDHAAKEQLRRIQARAEQARANPVLAQAAVPAAIIAQSSAQAVPLTAQQIASTLSGLPVATPALGADGAPAPKAKVQIATPEQIAAWYYIGDCLRVMREMPQKPHHIICDPPYGILMEPLAAGNDIKISRVAGTHTVAGNITLLEAFLAVAFEVIAEDGFLCMWYDLDHHEKIAQWAEAVGWKVCRWPVVWCKTSTCVNNAAQYNVTKATEVCYILRRSEKSIIKMKQDKNWIIASAVSSGTHPFVKPQEVWDYLIDTVSSEGDTILDPFAGEGSALASFFKKKRIPVGIEIDQTHVANGINFILDKINRRVASLNELLSDSPL